MAANAIKLTHTVENLVEEEVLGSLGKLTRKDLHNVPLMGTGYPKIYVCSPYAGETSRNVALAKQYCRYAIDKGYQPVASHLMYPGLLDDNDPLQREMGLAFGISLLLTCKEVWVFRGPAGVSAGMKKEIETALRAKIPVHYINDPLAFGLARWNPLKSYEERHTLTEEQKEPTPKRKRGRPRKDAAPVELPKRKRGRPRKDARKEDL